MDSLPALALRLQRYLEDVVPLDGPLQPHPERGTLPLAFQESFAPFVVSIRNRQLTFLLAEIDDPNATAQTLSKIGNYLQTQDLVLVADHLSATQRRILITRNTAFIVPDAHLWLPMLGMQFNEKAHTPVRRTLLAPATQALLIHWYHHGIEKASTMGEAAQALGYTTMSMSRAFSELIQNLPDGLHIERVGRERRCTTTPSPQALWQHYAPHARSPVTKTVLVVKTDELQIMPTAGMTALAKCSDLSPPAIPVRAVDIQQWRLMKEHVQRSEPYGRPNDGLLQLEIWSYPVRIHDRNSPLVEPLSLALSIPESEKDDPRVAIAIRSMEPL
jgi:hypothetical protein